MKYQKYRDGQGKWLLRQVLYRHVPRELEHVQGKRRWQQHLRDVLMFQAWLGEQAR